MGPVEESRPEIRVGDRERREVDAVLQHAYADGVLTMAKYEERSGQCWAARTRGELASLTADLPAPAPAPDPDPPAAAPAPLERVATSPTPLAHPADRRRRLVRGALAVLLAGAGLFATSRALTSDDAVSVFGSEVVIVAPGDDQVQVGVMFGSVRVVVPADARVQPSGTLIFGNTECDAACNGTGQRDVAVQSSGLFGSVTILRQGEPITADDDD
jgi:hypothetical protein